MLFGLFKQRPAEAARWRNDGAIDRAPTGPVGFESPQRMTDVASARGTASGRVRMPAEVAVGEDAPANLELHALGGVRASIADQDRAESSRAPRRVQAATGEHEAAQSKRHAYAQADLARAAAEVPARQVAYETARARHAEERRDFWALPVTERAAHGFGSRGRVELVAVLAAAFDAFALSKPLQAAGLAEGLHLWALIALVAGGIWVTVNALGVLAGQIALALPTERRRMAVVGFLAVVAALTTGFLLLGLARYAWTEQQNAALRDAASAAGGGIPTLLDPVFLTALQLAVAGAATAAVAIYVMGARGREAWAGVKRSGSAVAACADQLRIAESTVAACHRAVADADIEINVVRADGLIAAVDLDVLEQRRDAEVAGEEQLVQAAIARQEWTYMVNDKQCANGGVWLAAVPDASGVFGRRRRPARLANGGPVRPEPHAGSSSTFEHHEA